jgi:hypothetical protein
MLLSCPQRCERVCCICIGQIRESVFILFADMRRTGAAVAVLLS